MNLVLIFYFFKRCYDRTESPQNGTNFFDNPDRLPRFPISDGLKSLISNDLPSGIFTETSRMSVFID